MAIVLDIAASAGFQILSGLLRPRKVNNTPDNLPTQQFGEPIPRGWGTFSIPGVLMFAGDPNLNNTVQLDKKNVNTPAENASYASFLHSNPVTPKLLFLKLNGLAVASVDNNRFPLSTEIKKNKFVDVYGLTRFDQFNLRFYGGGQTVVDPMISRNGYGDLQYRGQCYIVVADALREVYGGRAVSVGVIIEDSLVTPSAAINGIRGFGDSPVEVEWDVVVGVFNSTVFLSLTAARGFQNTSSVAFFRGSGSIAPGNASTTVLIAGTLSQYRLTDTAVNVRVKPGSNTRFTRSVGQAGKFTTTVYSGSFPSVLTDRVIVGAPSTEIREVVLSSVRTSPFYSDSGLIYDSVGAQVGTCAANEDVMGWAGAIFSRSTIVPNTASIQTFTNGGTSLSVILRGLLSDIPGLTYQISFTADPLVTGYSTSNSNVTDDISNLLACYNKFVFQSRSGELVFIDYPTLDNSNRFRVKVTDHVSEPEMKFEPYDKIPGAINFSYQDTDREYDISSVRVGNDSVKIDNFAINVACDRGEALKLAGNLIHRIRSQTISGTLHLKPLFNQVLPGTVMRLRKLNVDGEDLTVLITRVETGADLTVRMEFVNFIPNVSLIPVVTNDYGAGVNPVVTASFFKVLDTERRSTSVGVGYVTDNPSQVTRAGISSNAIVTGTEAVVSSISYATAQVYSKQATPQVGAEIYVQSSITGEGSWCRVTSAVLEAANLYNITVISGLYGSSMFDNPVDKRAYYLREETVLNDGYATPSATQNGVLDTLSYPTRKRIVEPRLSGILVQETGFTAYRKSTSISEEDQDLTTGDAPLVYWRVRNLSVINTIYIASARGSFTVPFVLNKGDLLDITQVNAASTVLPGAYTNAYTIS